MTKKADYPKVYGAHAIDEAVVLRSSSGGIFTSTVDWFAEKHEGNYLVAGAVWDDDFRGVHHILSAQKKDIERMKISKYIQSKKGDIFCQVEEQLKKGKFILFTGCPCEIAGLKRFLRREYDNLYTVDFICKGSLSPGVMAEYARLIEKKYNSKICGINMRYKWQDLDVWIPQFMKIDFDNGKTMIKEFYNTELGHAFRIMQRESCYSCPFSETDKQSDLTMGDYHGADKNAFYFNRRGTSAVFVNTPKGENIFQGIAPNLKYGLTEAEAVYKHNKGFKDPARDLFGEYYKKEGLKKAIQKSLSGKDKLKLYLPAKLLRKITILKKGNNI